MNLIKIIMLNYELAVNTLFPIGFENGRGGDSTYGVNFQ